MEIYTSIETIVTGMLMAWFKSSKLSRKDFNGNNPGKAGFPN